MKVYDRALKIQIPYCFDDLENTGTEFWSQWKRWRNFENQVKVKLKENLLKTIFILPDYREMFLNHVTTTQLSSLEVSGGLKSEKESMKS